MAVHMTLTLFLADVTYGELYDFVDAARAAGVSAEEAVRCLGSDDRGDRFELDLGPERRRPGGGGAAAAVLGRGSAAGAGEARSGSSAPTGAAQSLEQVARELRSRIGDDDLDRVTAVLRDLRRFLR